MTVHVTHETRLDGSAVANAVIKNGKPQIARMVALEAIPAGAEVTVDVKTGNIKLLRSAEERALLISLVEGFQSEANRDPTPAEIELLSCTAHQLHLRREQAEPEPPQPVVETNQAYCTCASEIAAKLTCRAHGMFGRRS